MNDSATAGDAGYGSLDESALVERLRAGDEALFRDVVLALTPVLLRLARGYTPTAASAQDAVQDTWLVVLDKLDSFEGRSTLQTWVYGILVNKARRSGVRSPGRCPSAVHGVTTAARPSTRRASTAEEEVVRPGPGKSRQSHGTKCPRNNWPLASSKTSSTPRSPSSPRDSARSSRLETSWEWTPPRQPRSWA